MPESNRNEIPLIEKPYGNIGFWSWLLLYATGALLLVLVLVHLYALHILIAPPLTLKNVADLVGGPFLRFLEVCLLIVAVTHGLTGLRRVVLDLELWNKKYNKYLTGGLLAGGLGLAVWGLALFLRLRA